MCWNELNGIGQGGICLTSGMPGKPTATAVNPTTNAVFVVATTCWRCLINYIRFMPTPPQQQGVQKACNLISLKASKITNIHNIFCMGNFNQAKGNYVLTINHCNVEVACLCRRVFGKCVCVYYVDKNWFLLHPVLLAGRRYLRSAPCSPAR